jgi:hypothetical protein
MLRSSLVASAVALLCAAASAQQQLDLSRAQAITSPIRHAGVYNMQTGKFQRASKGAQTAVVQTIYNNSCNHNLWYVGLFECEDGFDEGRIPSGGVGADHNGTLWEIAYCTYITTGAVDIDWAMWDTTAGIGDSCAFGGTFPFPAALVGFSSSATGFPLPGSTTVGCQGCWYVGFTAGTAQICITSGAASADQFMYAFANNNSLASMGGANAAGPFLAGNPTAGAPGACTFAIPCATDPFTTLPCGTGLDTQDLFWINTDNVGAGQTPPAVCPGGSDAGPASTGCYWFGGFPTNPLASFYFRVEGDGGCSCSSNTLTYCTAKTSTFGCTPSMSATGTAQVALCASTSYNMTASGMVGNKNSIFFYSQGGPAGTAFHGGHLCMKSTKAAPIKRIAPPTNNGGQGTVCNGTLTYDFNVRICGGTDPAITAGSQINLQAWGRDPSGGGATGDQLSNGLQFSVCP